MMSEHPAPGVERPEVAVSAVDWREPLGRGQFGAAYRAFVVAEGTDPDVRQALSGLADVEGLLRDKAWSRAIKRFGQIEDRPAIVPWGTVASDLERLRRSGEALDRRKPDDALTELDGLESGLFAAEAETQRGTALIYDDRLPEASACFERALEADPRHFRALTNRGNVALEEGRIDDAILDYQRALSINDAFANAHHNLAVAYRRKGYLAKSVSSLKRAQRLMQRRDATEARDRLGSMGSGRTSRMLRWLLYAAAALVIYLVLHSRGML